MRGTIIEWDEATGVGRVRPDGVYQTFRGPREDPLLLERPVPSPAAPRPSLGFEPAVGQVVEFRAVLGGDGRPRAQNVALVPCNGS